MKHGRKELRRLLLRFGLLDARCQRAQVQGALLVFVLFFFLVILKREPARTRCCSALTLLKHALQMLVKAFGYKLRTRTSA